MHPLIREVQKSQLKKVPDIKAGYTVRVFQKISEYNKEKDETKDRIQIFEGLVIKVSAGEGIEKTFTVRKMVEGIGVDRVFPIHSQAISKIEVKKKASVRRAKLYYMRDRSGKSARLHERHVTDKERADEDAKMEALIQEAVVAEEKRKLEEEKAAENAVAEVATTAEEAPQA
jgi:large subunit ribosomal protein L19